MDFSNINWMAVIAAAASAFLVGGFWYSKVLFWNAWKEDSDLTTELLKTRNDGQVFGFTASFSILMAANLAIFLAGPKIDVAWGAEAGFLAGIWIFSAIAIHSLFELRSWRHIFIKGGYIVVSLTLMGVIISLWR
jgi:hypothetical protein